MEKMTLNDVRYYVKVRSHFFDCTRKKPYNMLIKTSDISI